MSATTAFEVPPRLRLRPVERGFVVPWFVAQVNGQYDFRIMDARKLWPAVRERRCWLCGQGLGRYMVFTVGPMCAINRVSSEPPAHRDCAEYAARVCPFLTQREVKRREGGMPEGASHAAGIPIMRQPGVALLWVTRKYGIERIRAEDGVGGGLLFRMGEPEEAVWLRQGRPATRTEVEASIDSGYPLLLAEAERDGPEAVALLRKMRAAVMPLLPPMEVA